MKYSDYKNKTNSQPEVVKNTKITSLEEYLEYRERCADYEQIDITDELTAEDYEAFEKNFEYLMDACDEKFEDAEEIENVWEHIHSKMVDMDWKWGLKGKVPSVEDLKNCAHHLFESCMESGWAKTFAGTGGLTVRTDIYNHRVNVRFDMEDWTWDDVGMQ